MLEKLRAGESLNAKEKLIHEKGLVSVLKQLHDDLDAAVFAAYGWPATLTDAEILERLVALNAERAAEEAKGIIHWLRPEYQTKATTGRASKQGSLDLSGDGDESRSTKPTAKGRKGRKAATPQKKQPWPEALAERVRAVESALHAFGGPLTADELAKGFLRAKPAGVAEILETLATLGRAHRRSDWKFTR